MPSIFTKNGYEILVDQIDFDEFSKHAWQINQRGYAYRKMKIDGRYKNVRMHRYVMGVLLGDPREVDHIDGNRLNNQRSNLRICSHGENMYNYKKPVTNTSGFKGVKPAKANGRWRADIRINGKQTTLGTFDDPETAYAAYCEAAARHRGEFASLTR